MKISKEEIGYLNALESISGASAISCVSDDKSISFLVDRNQMSAVIGKQGAMIKKIRERMKKNVDVFEYSGDVEDFIKKAFYNIELKNTKVNHATGEKVRELEVDSENKRKILQNPVRFRKLKDIMQKGYGIEKVRLK
jgi:NusA-like KH domain protein